jgi:putative alpha-1,2-mannosidase
MIAHHCTVVNKYIQSARLNGKELKVPWLMHKELIDNGVLELEMGPKPNKGWGVK